MNLANTLAQNIRSMVAGYTNRNARRTAIRSALMRVTNAHPEYRGVGFDEHFMLNKAAELMKPFVAGGPLPTSDALLTAWASQFPFSNESAKRAIANIRPVITDFLYVLDSEASTIPVLEQPASIQTTPSYVGTEGYNLA